MLYVKLLRFTAKNRILSRLRKLLFYPENVCPHFVQHFQFLNFPNRMNIQIKCCSANNEVSIFSHEKYSLFRQIPLGNVKNPKVNMTQNFIDDNGTGSLGCGAAVGVGLGVRVLLGVPGVPGGRRLVIPSPLGARRLLQTAHVRQPRLLAVEVLEVGHDDGHGQRQHQHPHQGAPPAHDLAHRRLGRDVAVAHRRHRCLENVTSL